MIDDTGCADRAQANGARRRVHTGRFVTARVAPRARLAPVGACVRAALVSVAVCLGAVSFSVVPAARADQTCIRPSRSVTALFDRLDTALNEGDGYKTYNNERATLAWGESYIMMSYVALYEGTLDPYYLHKLIDHADAVLQNRDDVRGVTDYRGVSGPCWRNLHYQDNDVPYCYVVHSGMITYPMARFAALVRQDPALKDLVAYDGLTFEEKAQAYIDRTRETINAHEWQWREGPYAGEGYYRFPADAPPPIPRGRNLPWNQQNAMGRTLVAMYEATGDTTYRDKARKLATLFKRFLCTDGDAYIWRYSNTLPDDACDGCGEDISHAAINVDFAAVAGRVGITFSDADLTAMANTFTDNVVRGEGSVWGTVGGCEPADDYAFQTGRWLGLSPHDSQGIYFTVQAIFQETFDWSSTGSGSVLYGLASLGRWERPMRLYGMLTGAGSASDWAGLAAADVDGDGHDEIAMIRNFDGTLYLNDYDATTGGFSSLSSYTGFPANSAWAGLAAGDLDGDDQDELVAVRNLDGNIFFLDSNGTNTFEVTGAVTGWGSSSAWAGVGVGTFVAGERPWVALVRNFDGNILLADYRLDGSGGVRASYTGFGNASQWADLAVGDFDGDGLDEIIVARNFDAHVFVLKVVNGNLSVIATMDRQGSASDWAALAAGDLNGDNIDEMLAVRNFDGSLYHWGLDGNAFVTFGWHEIVGASYAWGALGVGRFSDETNMLAGLSNRTGNLMVYATGSCPCTGNEAIKKAKCKNRRGVNTLKVKLARGTPGDSFTAELSTGQTIRGTLNNRGKAKIKFNNVPDGGGVVTTWGCGISIGRRYSCP